MNVFMFVIYFSCCSGLIIVDINSPVCFEKYENEIVVNQLGLGNIL